MADFTTLWVRKVPELRFMQLICNFQTWLGRDGFYLPDKVLIKAFKEFLDSITKKG